MMLVVLRGQAPSSRDAMHRRAPDYLGEREAFCTSSYEFVAR